ncbi:histidine kinase [Chryseobacterium sp. MYb264]|uniref:sensor histidine kinase n=1 Tax=Chryseobacterium sp. MYb264 TaxID=2745153 RepID=UPI002E14AA94|nr:histidine kinase [Chryseobacterium sp. MYb264]
MDYTSKRNIKKEIGYQAVFWISLLIFGLARNYGEHEQPNFKEIFYYDLCHWIFQIISANFIYFVLIRKYFDHRKYLHFSFFFLISNYFLGIFNRIFIVYLAEPLFVNYPQDNFISIFIDVKYLLFHYIFPILSGSFIFISIMYVFRYQNEKQTAIQLQKEKTELELKALKSQLHPHFLFNTLNNIYSLSIIDPSKTSQSIERLSDILDYTLYKGQKRLVAITEEMKMIHDYIELEKLRYDNRLKINVLENLSFPAYIPPLLYLSLVENAFKHGAQKTSGEIEINISIDTKTDVVIFKVENSKFTKQDHEKSRIGLENVKKQLELYYKNNYSLAINEKEDKFSIEIITPRNED